MSEWKTHDKVTLLLFPIILGMGWLLFGYYSLIIGISFLFSGLAFNGDLDIKSKIYNRWFILKWIWIPYQQFGHRSIWTHGIILGTIIRVLWIGVPIIGIMSIMGYSTLIMPFIITYKIELILVLIGLEVGNISHTFMDWVSTGFKKLFN
jgi:uncharacterized metal-binding protein